MVGSALEKKVAFELEREIPVKVISKGGSEQSFVSVNIPIGGRWQSAKGIIPGQFIAKGQFPNACMGERNHSNPGERRVAQGYKSCTTANHRLERMCNYQNRARGSQIWLATWKGAVSPGQGTKAA